MVARGDSSGNLLSQRTGRREHETDCGGVRELHWHTADEWAMVPTGARIAIEQEEELCCRCEEKRDLWYLPSGPPFIKARSDGTEFMLARRRKLTFRGDVGYVETPVALHRNTGDTDPIS
jgi:hypothetical protein